MIAGYRSTYLDDVMENLGIMFYLCGYFNIDKDIFWSLLVTSGVAEKIEMGNPHYLTGKSGVELMSEVVRCCGQDFDVDFPETFVGCENGDYWQGWILAYYQWTSGMSFSEIHEYIKAADLRLMYPACHQENEEKVADMIGDIIRSRKTKTNLYKYRHFSGMTQERLAELSGVNVRSIRAYEQQTKDINKASVEVVGALARALGCRAESLMEF